VDGQASPSVSKLAGPAVEYAIWDW
jgi:hypothetical protein